MEENVEFSIVSNSRFKVPLTNHITINVITKNNFCLAVYALKAELERVKTIIHTRMENSINKIVLESEKTEESLLLAENSEVTIIKINSKKKPKLKDAVNKNLEVLSCPI